MPELDELLAPLIDAAPAPPPIDAIERRSRRHARRRRARAALVATAALVIAVGVPLSRRGDAPQPLDTAGFPSALSGSTPATSSTPSTPLTPAPTWTNPTPYVPLPPGTTVPFTPVPTTPGAVATLPDGTRQYHPSFPHPPPDPRLEGDLPPWAANPPVAAADHPVTVAAWAGAGLTKACPALAFDDLGVGAGATIRATDRGKAGGYGAWWTVYDLPGAPGEAVDQTPTANAGKQTFFVSAVLSLGGPPGDLYDYQDGSKIYYGDQSPSSPIPFNIAYIQMGGLPLCLYQVGTYLGLDHLVHLLQHLRRVTGAP